jgi:hypothetical protein
MHKIADTYDRFFSDLVDAFFGYDQISAATLDILNEFNERVFGPLRKRAKLGGWDYAKECVLARAAAREKRSMEGEL